MSERLFVFSSLVFVTKNSNLWYTKKTIIKIFKIYLYKILSIFFILTKLKYITFCFKRKSKPTIFNLNLKIMYEG